MFSWTLMRLGGGGLILARERRGGRRMGTFSSSCLRASRFESRQSHHLLELSRRMHSQNHSSHRPLVENAASSAAKDGKSEPQAARQDPPDDAQKALDEFLENQPSNVLSGIGSGLLSVAGGLVLGAGSLVYRPIAGARKDGAKGFAKGLLEGVVSGVALPLAGVALGVVRIGQGIKNTPETVRSMLNKEVEPKDRRPLTAEEEEELKHAEEEMYAKSREFVQEEVGADEDRGKSAGFKGAVKDKEYYDVLGVQPTATSSEIKKKYYLLAKQYHPDKAGKDNLEAEAKFKVISEAYQTLIDPELRKKYDEFGKEGIDQNFVDPSKLFSMIFGSEQFEHLIGKLAMTSAQEEGSDREVLKKIQKQREDKLVAILSKRLDQWVAGQKEKFVEDAIKEVVVLREASFGIELCKTIGATYIGVGERMLGYFSPLGIVGHLGYFTETSRKFRSKVKAINAAAQLLSMDPNEMKEMEHSNDLQKQEEFMKGVFNNLYAVNVLDIESTLRHVCKRVCKDESISPEARKARCTGLIKLGQVFVEA